MEYITTNLASKPRVEREGDDEFIVVPLSLIVPGVLNGSQGALFYSENQIRQSVDAWNGVPLTLHHPSVGGKMVSAKEGGVVLGDIRNAQYNDKLAAEGWFNTLALKAFSPSLLDPIRNGEKIELSTGLFTDNRPVKNGDHKGTPYTHVAENYRPDHLAILPGEVGACSVADGCGVNVNKENRPILEQLKGLAQQTLNLIAGNSTRDAPVTNQGGPGMGLPEKERTATIDKLIASCCWEEEDRPVLNELKDDQLKRLQLKTEEDEQRQVVVNTAATSLGVDPKLALHEMPEALKKAAAAKEKGAKSDDDEEEDEEGNPVKKKKEPAGNVAPKVKWEDIAPPDVKEDLAFARAVKVERKDAIVNRLVANVAADKKASQVKVYNEMTLDQLTALDPGEPEKQPTTNYGTVARAGSSGEKQPTLGQRTWSFDKEEVAQATPV